jgi:hypothetical protein
MARSDIAHISICVISGISDAKSQNVSCADAEMSLKRTGLQPKVQRVNFGTTIIRNEKDVGPAAGRVTNHVGSGKRKRDRCGRLGYGPTFRVQEVQCRADGKHQGKVRGQPRRLRIILCAKRLNPLTATSSSTG